MIGTTVLGLIGRYGKGAHTVLPELWDLLVVVVFSLVMFHSAVCLALSPEQVNSAVETEERQLAAGSELSLPR